MKLSWKAIFAFALSLWLLFPSMLGLVLAVPMIFLANRARKDCKANKELRGDSLAVGALIISYGKIGLTIIFMTMPYLFSFLSR